MQIKVIVTETGDTLTRAETRNMKLPFTKGWELWGVFNDAGVCLDSFPRYAHALFFLDLLQSPQPLAA